jgi:hypothetical protein
MQYDIVPTYKAHSHSNEGSSDSTQSVFAFRPPPLRFSASALPVRARPHPVQASHITGGPALTYGVRSDIARHSTSSTEQPGIHLRSTAELREYNSLLSSPHTLTVPSGRIS